MRERHAIHPLASRVAQPVQWQLGMLGLAESMASGDGEDEE